MTKTFKQINEIFGRKRDEERRRKQYEYDKSMENNPNAPNGFNDSDIRAHNTIRNIMKEIDKKLKTKEQLHAAGHKYTPEVEKVTYELDQHARNLANIISGI